MLSKLKKLKQPKQTKQLTQSKNSSSAETDTASKVNKKAKPVFTIVTSVTLILAHVAVLLAIFLSFRYYAIYPSIFGSAVAIVLCLMIIVDIIFIVGFNHKDKVLKVITFVMALFIFIGGTVGSYAVSQANGIVNNVLDDGSNKYETFSGYFVCYSDKHQFSSLSDLNGKTIGLLLETTDGLTYVATDILSKQKIDYATKNYKTNAEMMQGLLDGDVDAIAITSAYRTIYGNDENSSFGRYLDKLIDIEYFEKELKVDTGKKKKNVSTDPFNVLLIGYSRTDIGSPVGLADSIILTTINPQTYTVSMMSIARDSFVPISCYGGEYDKINSGRSTSRACFIETVEDFLDMDIDYYMELDYLGLVAIVNAIGGIKINNPVSFELDGIYVPAGEGVFADGQMALQFCRERHHMPNGDFDRQQHQKEVIIAIAKKFVKSGDITLALNAMKAASNWMSTDMSLNQLTTVFNLLLNTKNYTSLDTFDLVDFQTLRITGDGGIKYYSYSMRLPLWVYLIYQGSYDESIAHIKEVMGTSDKINQDYKYEMSVHYPYVRAPFYSLDYENKFLFTPDPMPPYWADLIGLSESEAKAWASANGVSLSVKYINYGDPAYNEKEQGLVVDQSVRYGSLIKTTSSYSGYSSGTITVMGLMDPDKVVPNFVGSSYKKVVEWARSKGIPYDIKFDASASGEVGQVVSQNVSPYSPVSDCSKIVVVVKAGKTTISFDANGADVSVPGTITVITGDDTVYFKDPTPSSYNSGGVKYVFKGWYTSPTGVEQVFDSDDVGGNVTLYAHWGEVKMIEVTFDWGDGSKEISIEEDDNPFDYIGNPSKSGYDFDGWVLNSSKSDDSHKYYEATWVEYQPPVTPTDPDDPTDPDEPDDPVEPVTPGEEEPVGESDGDE